MKKLLMYGMILTLLVSFVAAIPPDASPFGDLPYQVDLGGVCDTPTGWDTTAYGDDACVMWDRTCSEDDREATVDLYIPEEPVVLHMRYLDESESQDAFQIWVGPHWLNGVDDNNPDFDVWVDKYVCVDEHIRRNLGAGVQTVKFVASDDPWGQCADYGQIAFDYVAIEEDTEGLCPSGDVPEFGVVGMLTAISMLGLFIIKKR